MLLRVTTIIASHTTFYCRRLCRYMHALVAAFITSLRAPENTTDKKRRPSQQRPPVLSVIAVISYRLQPVNFYIAQIFAAVKAVLN